MRGATATAVRCVLAVNDLETAAAWYRGVLGMREDFTAPGWAFLSRGAFRLMLGHCADALPPAQLGDPNG